MTFDMEHMSGFIIDLNTNEKLEFQYNPTSISDSKNTDYASIKIPGLSHPRYQYVSGGARQINFKLNLFMGEVSKKVNWLRSLEYPKHEGSILKNAPPRILLVMGDLYSGVECIVKSVKVVYMGLFDPKSLLPRQADIDIVLEEYIDESVAFDEVRG